MMRYFFLSTFLLLLNSHVRIHAETSFAITDVDPGSSAKFVCTDGGTCCMNPDDFSDIVTGDGTEEGGGVSIINQQTLGSCGIASDQATALQCQISPRGCFVSCTADKCETCTYADGEEPCTLETESADGGETGTTDGEAAASSTPTINVMQTLLSFVIMVTVQQAIMS